MTGFGTAYGREPKVLVLGREALALMECEKLDRGECAGFRVPYDKESFFCLIHNQLEERKGESK